MKKYFILFLVCIAFISCKDDEIKDISGAYTATFSSNVYFVRPMDCFVLKKIDNDSYYLAAYYNNGTRYSPLSILRCYDENRIKGKFYNYDYIFDQWLEGDLDLVIDNNKISGSFSAIMLVPTSSVMYPISRQLVEGNINLKYNDFYSNLSNLPKFPAK